MKQHALRKIEVLLAGAIAGLFLGPVFFDETGFGWANVVSVVIGAFVAVVVYELVARLRH